MIRETGFTGETTTTTTTTTTAAAAATTIIMIIIRGRNSHRAKVILFFLNKNLFPFF